MTPRLPHARRGERAFERLYRRHVGDVYRYALVLLRDALAAEEVTRTTFLRASCARERGSSPHVWLLRLAHADCRRRAQRADQEDTALGAATEALCPNLQAVSTLVDGRLTHSERKALRRHVRECDECTGFARSQQAQRFAWCVLRATPLPDSLRNVPWSVTRPGRPGRLSAR